MEERTFLVTFATQTHDYDLIETGAIRAFLRNSCDAGALYFKDVQLYIPGNNDRLSKIQAIKKIRNLTDLSLTEAKNLTDLAQLRISIPTVQYRQSRSNTTKLTAPAISGNSGRRQHKHPIRQLPGRYYPTHVLTHNNNKCPRQRRSRA